MSIDIFSLLVGVEVCEGVLDYIGENDLLQVIHLAIKSLKYKSEPKKRRKAIFSSTQSFIEPLLSGSIGIH